MAQRNDRGVWLRRLPHCTAKSQHPNVISPSQSEQLSLEEEYVMQATWKEDPKSETVVWFVVS